MSVSSWGPKMTTIYLAHIFFFHLYFLFILKPSNFFLKLTILHVESVGWAQLGGSLVLLLHVVGCR